MIGKIFGSDPHTGVEQHSREQSGGPSPEMRRQMEAARQRLAKYHTVYERPELGGPPTSAVRRSEEP